MMQENKLYIKHHGVKGQKWGIRRYQNEDGSLTPRGEKRYTVDDKGQLTKKPMSEGKKTALIAGSAAVLAASAVGAAWYLKNKRDLKIKIETENYQEALRKMYNRSNAQKSLQSRRYNQSLRNGQRMVSKILSGVSS